VLVEVEEEEIVVVIISHQLMEYQDLLEEYQKELLLSLLEIIQYMLVVGEKQVQTTAGADQIIVDLGLEITAEEILVLLVLVGVLEVVAQAVVLLECRNLLV
jgi:hypothetical protein